MHESPKKILLVDDERDITDVLKRGLELAGLSVTAFNDAEEALMYYEPRKYDLLLIDIRMPRMNGFELYKLLRAKDPSIRVCFLTAFEIFQEEFKKLFPKHEIHCFIKKPSSIEKLTQIIREQIGNG